MRRWRLFASAGIAGVLATGLFGAAGAGGVTFTNWPQYLYSPSTFAQPVFADNYLFTASQGTLGLQSYTVGG
jgi:acyl dehydratase